MVGEMTIIYIVTEGDYSDYHIEAVCSSPEKCVEWQMLEYKDVIESYGKSMQIYEDKLTKPLEQRDKTWAHEFKLNGDYESDEYLQHYIKQFSDRIDKLKIKLANREWDTQNRIEEYVLDRLSEPRR